LRFQIGIGVDATRDALLIGEITRQAQAAVGVVQAQHPVLGALRIGFEGAVAVPVNTIEANAELPIGSEAPSRVDMGAQLRVAVMHCVQL
jgi:hypothetical protein